MERGRAGRKRTAGALAAAATAGWVALGSGPASAALVAERHSHTFVAPGGSLVTCDVITTQSWLDGEARVSTELTGPEACAASVVTVRWRYTDEDGEAVSGHKVREGRRRVAAVLEGVEEGSLVSRHRVYLDRCAEDCVAGPYTMALGSTK